MRGDSDSESTPQNSNDPAGEGKLPFLPGFSKKTFLSLSLFLAKGAGGTPFMEVSVRK